MPRCTSRLGTTPGVPPATMHWHRWVFFAGQLLKKAKQLQAGLDDPQTKHACCQVGGALLATGLGCCPCRAQPAAFSCAPCSAGTRCLQIRNHSPCRWTHLVATGRPQRSTAAQRWPPMRTSFKPGTCALLCCAARARLLRQRSLWRAAGQWIPWIGGPPTWRPLAAAAAVVAAVQPRTAVLMQVAAAAAAMSTPETAQPKG